MRIVEIGGNIGWITVHFARCAGRGGEVVVLEASPANIRYLRENTFACDNVTVIEAAASDREGEAEFFMESLTGQNDSLIPEYGILKRNETLAFSEATVSRVKVRTVRVDDLVRNMRRPIGLVKIDVEGAERKVLEGMMDVLSCDRPAVAIEVTRERNEVFRRLEDLGYIVLDASLARLESSDSEETNLIALHCDRHSDMLAESLGSVGAAGHVRDSVCGDEIATEGARA